MKMEPTIKTQTNEQNIEIDLRELLGYFFGHLPLLVGAVVIGALIAGMITHFFITDKFTATARMYMVSASSDSVVNLADLNLGTSLSNDYVELMQSRPIVEEVIDKLELEYNYEQLINMLSFSVVNNTRIVRISVTSTDAEEAMDIANQMAHTARNRLPRIMDAPTPSIAEEAVLPMRRSAPSLKKNVMAGALVLLLAVLAILTLRFMLDDTIKTAEDLEKAFGVMPLSVIPEGDIPTLKREEKVIRRTLRSRFSRLLQKKGKGVTA